MFILLLLTIEILESSEFIQYVCVAVCVCCCGVFS